MNDENTIKKPIDSIQSNMKNNMDYELAKKLKDAGFPQKGRGCLSHSPTYHIMYDSTRMFYTDEQINQVKFKKALEDNEAYIPTLEELIEATGEEFGGLYRNFPVDKCMWSAHQNINRGGASGYDDTHIKAVANLWLKLNKK